MFLKKTILSSTVLILFANVVDKVSAQTPLPPISEICNNYNGRRLYLELNEAGALMASNVVIPGAANVNDLVSLKFSNRANARFN